jgi:multicomponent Na+:H+ antiporter subunit C
MVDPLPQALMLTAIVVGICIIALGLALAVLIYRRFGSLDIRSIEREAWRSGD